MRTWLVLLVVWTLLFSFLTLQNGEATEVTGSSFSSFLRELFNLPWTEGKIHGWLRTAAHVVSFLVEAVLLTLVLSSAGVDKSRAWSLVVCLVLSVLAEGVKLRVPGRHMSVVDMGWNAAGTVVGVLISFLFRR